MFYVTIILELKDIGREDLVPVSLDLTANHGELVGESIEHIRIDRYRLLNEPADAVGISRHTDYCGVAFDAYFDLLSDQP